MEVGKNLTTLLHFLIVYYFLGFYTLVQTSTYMVSSLLMSDADGKRFGGGGGEGMCWGRHSSQFLLLPKMACSLQTLKLENVSIFAMKGCDTSVAVPVYCVGDLRRL